MDYKKDNEILFTNEDTLVRRAWIDSAIEGVRERISDPLPVPEAGDLGCGARLDPDAALQEGLEATGSHLKLVWSAGERRSGT